MPFMLGGRFFLCLLLVRIALTALGAAALLYVFSFPYSIIPPNPEWDYAEGLTPESFRPLLWLVPWAFMELVSSLGAKRNLVWFCGLGLVLSAAVLAWPVLEANYPELVHRPFSFDDGKLEVGLAWLGAFTFGSVLLRGVLLSFLFMKPREEELSDVNYADAELLDPANARTVREIAANPVRVQPRFRFGDADMGLVERFRLMMKRWARLRAWRWGAMLAAVVLVLAWFFFYPQPTEEEAYRRDLARMYDVRGYAARESLPASLPVRAGAKGVYLATTPAVHAAYRVMSRVAERESLAGMKRSAAEDALGVTHAFLPRGYREQLRDESDVSLPSVNDIFDSRTRFLTVTDGKRSAVLYVRFGEDDETVNIAEVQDAGWNARADYIRFRYGADVNSRILN